MEVFEAVRTALAIRNYKETSVPADVTRKIVEAGRLSGSAMNGQPWHFIAVDDRDTLRELGSVARTAIGGQAEDGFSFGLLLITGGNLLPALFDQGAVFASRDPARHRAVKQNQSKKAQGRHGAAPAQP